MPWSDGGTLEQYLIDLGVRRWPVTAELDLYETMPGTSLGHFTRDETLPAGEVPSFGEYQLLTPEVAGFLLGEPGSDAASRVAVPGRIMTAHGAGQRYFRVRVAPPPGATVRRPRRRVSVRWEPGRRRMRIALRLSERRARTLQARCNARPRRASGTSRRCSPPLREILSPATHADHPSLLRSAFVTDPVVAAQLARRVAGAARCRALELPDTAGRAALCRGGQLGRGRHHRVTFDGIGTRPGQVPVPQSSLIRGWTWCHDRFATRGRRARSPTPGTGAVPASGSASSTSPRRRRRGGSSSPTSARACGPA